MFSDFLSLDQELETIVCDIDGTLSDSAHRTEHAKNGNWDLFHEKSFEDKPHEDVKNLLEFCSLRYNIILCTGRNEKYRQTTENWLWSNKLGHLIDHILMRPDNNWEKDHELKPQMLEEYFEGKESALKNVAFVLDDRDKVVEAWRDYGLSCWQVRMGAF